MEAEDLKKRTKEFAKRVIRLCRKLPNSRECWRIGDQIFRSGTSVGANYRAACRGRSKAEFVAKLGTVIEEADETLYWMELLTETGIMQPAMMEPLMKECDELLSIFVASTKTARNLN